MNTSNPPHWTLNSSFVEFLSVWVHLGLFCYGSKSGAKRIELVQLMKKFMHEVISELFTLNAPDPPNWTLNSFFGVFPSFRVHLESFFYYRKISAKRAELD